MDETPNIVPLSQMNRCNSCQWRGELFSNGTTFICKTKKTLQSTFNEACDSYTLREIFVEINSDLGKEILMRDLFGL